MIEEAIYNEISVDDILDAIKLNLSKNENKTALYYLNLLRYSQPYDLKNKLNFFSLFSIVVTKMKNVHDVIRLGRKVLKFVHKINIKNFPIEIVNAFVKILIKVGQCCHENEKHLLAGWFIYVARNLYTEYNLKSEDVLDTCKRLFPDIVKKITASLAYPIADSKEKRTNLKRLSEQITKFTSEGCRIPPDEESVYLISKTWLNSMNQFVKHLNDPRSDLERIFNTNNICLLYYSKDNLERSEHEGVYPGPINNFLLTSGKDRWIDPIDPYANVYIDKDIKETDYVIMPKGLYNQIKFYFDSLVDIERKVICGTTTPDVQLIKFDALIINETIREEFPELIKPRALQMSKHTHIDLLENKLNSILKDIMKDSSTQYEFKIYLAEKDHMETFELILCYMNRTRSFKIKGKDLKSYEGVKTIGDLNLNNKSLLIIEAISKDMLIKPYIKITSDNLHCSLCNFKIIESDKMVKCDSCLQNIYCTDKCRSDDIQHEEFHKRTSKIYKRNVALIEKKQSKLNLTLDSDSKCGLVGLKNLGNSCFLNSAIQCLSHCEDLTKYFLKNEYLNDMKGERNTLKTIVTSSYNELLRDLWYGHNTSTAPFEMKQIFSALMKNTGIAFPDPHDVFAFLFHKLHEELNRVTRVGDGEVAGKFKDESDNQASERIWEEQMKTDDSIIVDLFQGQLKTRIKCSSCKRTMTAFDPFTCIPLPIPDKSEMTKIKFKVFPNNYEYKYFNIYLYDVHKFTSVRDLKQKAKESKSFKKSEFDAILYKNRELQCVLNDEDLIYDYVFQRIDFAADEFIDYEITLVEVEQSSTAKNKGEFVTFYISPIQFVDQSYYYFFNSKGVKSLTYAKAFSMSKKQKVKDLYKEVFKYYRRSMDDMLKTDSEGNMDTSYYTTFFTKISDNEFVDKEFEKFLSNDQQLDLYLLNNIPPSNSWIYGRPSCEYCNSRKCNFCKLAISKEATIYEFYALQQVTREFIIYADFTKFKDMFHRYYEETIDKLDPRNMLTSSDVNIYDCLELHQIEETSTKENPLPCPTCNKGTDVKKKMEIYIAPKYLIFQLKRFKFKGFTDLMQIVNNKKNDTLIDFPLTNLDMSNFIRGNDKEKSYELIAVAQHVGELKGGKFSALCRNNESWYQFKDEEVKKVEEFKIDDAYILVYKLTKDKGDNLDLHHTSINSTQI